MTTTRSPCSSFSSSSSSHSSACFLLSHSPLMNRGAKAMMSSAGEQRRETPRGSSLLPCYISSPSSFSSSFVCSGEGASFSSRNGCPRREDSTTSLALELREISSERVKEKKGKRADLVTRDRPGLVCGSGLYSSGEGPLEKGVSKGNRKNIKKIWKKERREEEVREDLWKEGESHAQGNTKEGCFRGGDRKDHRGVTKERGLSKRTDVCSGDRDMACRRQRNDCGDDEKKLVDPGNRRNSSRTVSLSLLPLQVSSSRCLPYVGEERIASSSRRTMKRVTTTVDGDDRRRKEEGGFAIGETREEEEEEGGRLCMRRGKKREGVTKSEKRQEHVKETAERDAFHSTCIKINDSSLREDSQVSAIFLKERQGRMMNEAEGRNEEMKKKKSRASHMDKNSLDGLIVEKIYLDGLVTGARADQQEGKEEKENTRDSVLSMVMKRLRQDKGERKRKMTKKKKRLFFFSSPCGGSTESAFLLTAKASSEGSNGDRQRMNSLFSFPKGQSSVSKGDRSSFSSCLSPPPYMRFWKKEARGGGKITDPLSFPKAVQRRTKDYRREGKRSDVVMKNSEGKEGGGEGIADEEGRNLWSCLSSSSSFSVTTDNEMRDGEKKKKGYEGYAEVVSTPRDNTVSKRKRNRLGGFQEEEEKEEIVFFRKGYTRGRRLGGDADARRRGTVLVMRENKKNVWGCSGRRGDVTIGERSERRRRRLRSLSNESLPHFYVVKKNGRRSPAVTATPLSFHRQREDSLYTKKQKRKDYYYYRRLHKYQENEGILSLKEAERCTEMLLPDASETNQQRDDERIEKERKQVDVVSCATSRRTSEQVEKKECMPPTLSSGPRQDSQEPEKKKRTPDQISSALSLPGGRRRTERSVAHFPCVCPCGCCGVSPSLSSILPLSPPQLHHPNPLSYPLLSSTHSRSPFILRTRSIPPPVSVSPPILASPPVLSSFPPPLVPLPRILSSAPSVLSSPSLVSSAPLLPSPPVVSSPPLLPSPPMLLSPRALLPTSSSVLPCAHYFPQNSSRYGRSSLPLLSVARSYSRPVFPSAPSSPPILSSPRVSPTSSSLLGHSACLAGQQQSNRTVAPACSSALLPCAPPLLSSPPPFVSFTPSMSSHSACASPPLSRTSDDEQQGDDNNKRTISSLCKASSSVSFSREDGSLQMFFKLFSQAKGDTATRTSHRREKGSPSEALEPTCGRHSDTSLAASTAFHARAASQEGLSAAVGDTSSRSPTVSTASSSLPSVGGTPESEGGGGCHMISSIVKKETACISSSAQVKNSCSTLSRKLLATLAPPQDRGRERQRGELTGGGKGVRDDVPATQEKVSGGPLALVPVISDGEPSQRGSREGWSPSAVACGVHEEKLEGLSSAATSTRTYVTAASITPAVRTPARGGNEQGKEEEDGALPVRWSDHHSMVSLSLSKSSTVKASPSRASFTLLELLKCRRKTPEPQVASVLPAQGSSSSSRTRSSRSSSHMGSHGQALGYNRSDVNVEEGCNAMELERKEGEREEVVSAETDVQFSSSSFLSSILSSFAYDIPGKTRCSSDRHYRETSETYHYPTDSCLVRDLERRRNHDDNLSFTPYEVETGDFFFSSSTRGAAGSTAQVLPMGERDERKELYTTESPGAERREEVFLSFTEREEERSSWKMIERGVKTCEVGGGRGEVGKVFAIPSFMQTPSPHTVPFPPSFFQM